MVVSFKLGTLCSLQRSNSFRPWLTPRVSLAGKILSMALWMQPESTNISRTGHVKVFVSVRWLHHIPAGIIIGDVVEEDWESCGRRRQPKYLEV
jgi:hypothetical protein